MEIVSSSIGAPHDFDGLPRGPVVERMGCCGSPDSIQCDPNIYYILVFCTATI